MTSKRGAGLVGACAAVALACLAVPAFASFLFVSPPGGLGSGSVQVQAPPGISVEEVKWELSTTDPGYVDNAVITIVLPGTEPFSLYHLYIVVKDAQGNVLQTKDNPYSAYLSGGNVKASYRLRFSPDLPAENIALIAVTVIPA
jgi:hypothetical protein